MLTEKVVRVNTLQLVMCFLNSPYPRDGTVSAAINCAKFALPPPTTGNLDRIATSNDLHANVVLRIVTIHCCAQTAKVTPSFRLPVLLTKTVIRVVNPRREASPRKNHLRVLPSLLCLKSPLIKVIVLHTLRDALT